jgi:hypothetical protein
MSEFESKWQECIGRARQAEADPIDVPAGFATRAWAEWTARASHAADALWPVLSLRALILTTIVLAMCIVTELCSASADTVFAPHLEDVVTTVWRMP